MWLRSIRIINTYIVRSAEKNLQDKIRIKRLVNAEVGILFLAATLRMKKESLFADVEIKTLPLELTLTLVLSMLKIISVQNAVMP